MGLQEIVALHKSSLASFLEYWPVAIFLLGLEIFLILKSRHFTRRGGIEATISTAIPFLLAVWLVSVAPESVGRGSDAAPLGVSVWLPVILVVGGVLVRTTILQIFFQTRTVWEFIASMPLPAFVYFTGYVALK